MKIRIIKSGNSKTNNYAACPFFVDSPTGGDDARRAASTK
jgi:hypothetical protein